MVQDAPAGALPPPNPCEASGYPSALAAAYDRANAYWANEVDFNRQSINSDATNASSPTIDSYKGKSNRGGKRGYNPRPANEKSDAWDKEVTRKTTGAKKKIKDMTLEDKPTDYGCKPCKTRFSKGHPGVQRLTLLNEHLSRLLSAYRLVSAYLCAYLLHRALGA